MMDDVTIGKQIFFPRSLEKFTIYHETLSSLFYLVLLVNQ